LPVGFHFFFRRLVVTALDQLTGGGNANAAENSISLADVDLVWRKIDVGIQVFYLGASDSDRRYGQRENQFRIADINSVLGTAGVVKGGVIYVERNAANPPDGVFTVFIIKNANILRDQTPKWIERDAANRSLHAMFAQLLHHQSPPFLAEPLFREIQPPPANAPSESTARKRTVVTKTRRANDGPRSCGILSSSGRSATGMQILSFRGNDVFN